MEIFSILSALLQYPQPELIAALPEIEAALAPTERAALRPLLDSLGSQDLVGLQMNYVATFDRNPAHSLHLFEHIHGESRDRGQAMVDLMEEYKKHGLQMVGDELPDYVPLFLEFLSTQDQKTVDTMLSDAVHVLAHVGRKLRSNGSPYAGIFDIVEQCSPVVADELSEPPVHDMDEALETFGPGADGVEPLLRTAAGAGVQPINFYPKARAAA
ncbi:nitrate reductase molybdenum cofactor assembly chaperone [Massilia sp. TS11]|uniref:nitrate reductase molybdenum cofactor assembly chaperone n=1 Tax=Massilia sp. TS11 TaxID=2908003 RepID=UPI001EDAE6F1|nr:nitrate reductase molybdenum cofactor assembly chaperone [Massilia sp. TS11]MCG2585946.1 nitrate reductase molybdenum cofactor assembly chaperone [Massilia sp. TS11]